ncbi:MAG: hypothetical protein ACUVQG_13375 [Thermogutta sp.]
MKKLGSLLIILALSGLFLGCQKPAQAPTPGGSTPAATAKSTEAPSDEAQPAKQQTEAPAESTGGEAQQ